MKTARFKRAALAAVLLLLTAALCACSGARKITKAEVAEVLPTLVEKSKELNEIYFGDGFPPEGSASLPENGYYYVDSEYYGFYSIEQIKEATEEVFTPEYSHILYASAFDGLANGDAVTPPRYAEGELGLMQSVRSTVYDLAERSFDFETLKLKKANRTRATVSVETTDGDGNHATIELIIVRTTDETGAVSYRLDSPTY